MYEAAVFQDNIFTAAFYFKQTWNKLTLNYKKN